MTPQEVCADRHREVLETVADAGSDYNLPGVSLSWADGESGEQTVLVTVVDDSDIEADESFTLQLANAGGGAVADSALHTVSIWDNDSASLCAPENLGTALDAQSQTVATTACFVTQAVPQPDAGNSVTLNAGDSVQINVAVTPDPGHRGYEAEILNWAVYFQNNTTLTYFHDGVDWQVWDGDWLTLQSTGISTLLDSNFTVDAFQGTLDQSAELTVYTGYRFADGSVVYNDQAPTYLYTVNTGGTTPGQGGTPPGQGGTPPGTGTATPGQGGTPPGQGGTPPGTGTATPGQGGTPPGQGGTPPGTGTATPGQGGTPPGQGGTPPGTGTATPGQGGTPPGQGGTAPGAGNGKGGGKGKNK